MGASGWNYLVPYQPDISAALRELREKIFRNGDYHKREPLEINEDDYADEPEEVREQVPFWIQHEKSLPEPTTIATLLEWNGEEGTHSIIDIEAISPTPRFGAAAPLSKEQLETFFGTDQPTHNMIESTNLDLALFLQQKLGRRRYEATYILVFKNGLPDEIFFIGYSGD